MSESPRKSVSDKNLEDSTSTPDVTGGFDEKEPSLERFVTPDLRFSTPGGVYVGDSGGNNLLPEFDRSSVIQMPISTEEQAMNSFEQESNGETESIGKEEEVIVEEVSPKIEESTLDHQVNHDENGVSIRSDDSVRDDNQAEDVGKEEMFVDASDDIDTDESVSIIQTHENVEEKLELQESHFQLTEDSVQSHQLIDELAGLRTTLEKTVADKETMAMEYKEEREIFARELVVLHRKLEVMSSIENGGKLDDSLSQREEEGGTDNQDSTNPLQVIADCSKLTTRIEIALNEHLQSVGTTRQLENVVMEKDREIEELNAKIGELSVSHSVVVSYLESLQSTWSETSKELSTVHNDREMHVEVVSNRLIASLATVVEQEELENSVTDKLSVVEKSTLLMIENYHKLLSDIDHFKLCLNEVKSDFMVPDVKDYGIVFSVACEELLECKRKEADFVDKLSQLEVENKKLVEQLDKEKESLGLVNAELSKTKTEVEQEKVRTSTAKEKLSMAVTKGKALVQQRDSLKQSLAEKTNELEACLNKLQEKSSALEAVEGTAEELATSQILVASLQESLAQKDLILKDIEEIVPEIMLDELQSMGIIERVGWLVDKKNTLENISSEFNNLRDMLSKVDLPETITSSSLDLQINWLIESFSQAKADLMKLQGEVASAWVSVGLHESELSEARNEIDLLTSSLSSEREEKNTLRMALEDLSCKYEAVSEKGNQISSERDGIIRMLREASQMDIEEFDHSDISMFVEKCIKSVKEQTSASFENSHFGTEQFERMQSLLYIWNLDIMLCNDILEGETVERSKLMNLSSELERVSEEIGALRDENKSLQKDLERSEDKTALIREKLSMAVKKGKGLVQERENLKHALDEKNKEIENVKLELQQQESVVAECRDQIHKLSSDLERMVKLESDLVAIKEQKDQLEQFLLESNSELQRVIKLIETVPSPDDAVFEEPVEKVKWLMQCFQDSEVGKTRSEQQLETVNQEAMSLSSKLAEAFKTIRALEDELLQVKEGLSLLEEEKKKIQSDKACVEDELEKEKEKASLHVTKFEEVLSTIKSLEDALSLAEKNISVLTEEKTATELDKDNVEKELEKAKEEADSQANELAEANQEIKLLGDTLAEVENRFSVFAVQKNDAEAGKSLLEKEVEEAKSEASLQASKVEEAHTTIKALEDALSQAQNDISLLANEKKNAEHEIITLNARLGASLEELAGTRGSSEGQSEELLGHLNNLEIQMKDGALLSMLKQGFKEELESLRDMHLLVEGMRDQFVDGASDRLPGKERDLYLANPFPAGLENIANGFIEGIDTSAADLDDISSYFTRVVEGFNMKDKLIRDNFEDFSSAMEELVAVLRRALQMTIDGVVMMRDSTESLNQKVKNLEIQQLDQESVIHTLQNDVISLLSACKVAIEELSSEAEGSESDLKSNLEVEKLNYSLYSGEKEIAGDSVEEQRDSSLAIEDVKAAENLLHVARKVRTQKKQFENIKNASEATIRDLQYELEGARLTIENVVKERDINRDRVSKLESDVEELQISCNRMKLKLDDYDEIKDTLGEREAEISSLRSTIELKRKEEDGRLLSEGQVKILVEKMNGIEAPFNDSELENSESYNADPVKKLFYIMDTVAELQNQLELSSREKDELQSSLAANHHEIECLKKESESAFNLNQELEKAKSDFTKLTSGLEKIVQKLKGDNLVEDQGSDCVRDLLPLIEKLVKELILECEHSKANAQELGAELQQNQKSVEELSAKVKLLEDSIRSSLPPSISVQERSIIEASSPASGSEISEIETMGPLARNSTSPSAPYVPHARTMRKGSSDHLALNIDGESDRLINHQDNDDDKGHVFKSLNTSGLIPKQGKLLADRIDGIWVSGGRLLMSQPRARIGLVAYWLFLHIWLLGTIL